MPANLSALQGHCEGQSPLRGSLSARAGLATCRGYIVCTGGLTRSPILGIFLQLIHSFVCSFIEYYNITFIVMFIEHLLCAQHSVGSRHSAVNTSWSLPSFYSQSSGERDQSAGWGGKTGAQCCVACRPCGRTEEGLFPGFRALRRVSLVG